MMAAVAPRAALCRAVAGGIVSADSARERCPVVLRAVLEPSDEGGYTVYVPALPGCVSEGETVEEAMANIREAAELYLEPADDDPHVAAFLSLV